MSKKIRITQEVRNAIRYDRRPARDIALEYGISMNSVYQIRGSVVERDEDGAHLTIKERGWKRCVYCKEQLPLDKFYKDRMGSGGLSSRCKPCDLLRKTLKDNLAHKNKISLLQHIKKNPCERCAAVVPPEAMQFDHLPGHTKRFEISMYRNASLTDLALEIAKCQLVCANCHLTITRERRDSPAPEEVPLTPAAQHYLSTILQRYNKGQGGTVT